MASLHRQLDTLQQQLAAIEKRLPEAANRFRGDLVFVVGCPRSGTSAIAWAVAEHPAFITGPESNFLYYLAGQGLPESFRRGNLHPGCWMKNCGVDYQEYAESIGYGIRSLFASRARGLRWVDSSTENALVVDNLVVMFPEAKFLHVIRDGRDVVASLMASGFGLPHTENFTKACETWEHFVRWGLKFEAAYPDRVLGIRNETLADHADEMIRFLGEKPSPAVGKYFRRSRINSSFDKDGKPRAREQKPWMAWSEDEAAIFERIAGPMLRSVGYGVDAG